MSLLACHYLPRYERTMPKRMSIEIISIEGRGIYKAFYIRPSSPTRTLTIISWHTQFLKFEMFDDVPLINIEKYWLVSSQMEYKLIRI